MTYEVYPQGNGSGGGSVAETRYLDAYTYGFRTGNTRQQNYAAINNAFTAALALSINRVHVDGGRFLVDPFTQPNDIQLTGAGPGVTEFDFSQSDQALFTANKYSAIVLAGSITEVGALSTVAANAIQIQLAAGAATFTPGTIGIIYNDTDFSFNAARFYYRAGEFFRATSNNGANIVTLDNRLYAGYVAGANMHVYRVTPVNGQVSGISIIGPGDLFEVNGLSVILGHGVVIRDVFSEGCIAGAIKIDRCYDMYLDGLRTFDTTSAVGSNYGLAILTSQRVTVNNCVLHASRHGLTIGGGTTTVDAQDQGGVVNRDLLIDGCIVTSDPTGLVSAADMHGNVEFVTYKACRVRGAHIAGNHTSLIDCDIEAATNNGEAIHATELVGWDHKIEGCTVRARGAIDGSYGLINITEVTQTISDTSGVLRIASNKVEQGDFNGTAIYVYNNDLPGAPDNLRVEIIDNTLRYTGPQATAALVQVRASPGKGWDSVIIDNNKGYGVGFRIDGANAPNVSMSGNTALDAAGGGIEVIPNATPIVGIQESIICKDNTVMRAYGCGILIVGMQNGGVNQAYVTIKNNVSLDNAQGGFTGSSSTTSSLYASQIKHLELEGNTFGDRQAVRTQVRWFALADIDTRVENDNTIQDSDLSDPLTSNYTNAGNKINRVVDQSLTVEGWDAGPPVVSGTAAWAVSTAYALGIKIQNGGYVYVATTGGVSAAVGTGPSTKGAGIVDGTVVWAYAGENIGGYYWQGATIQNTKQTGYDSPILWRKFSAGWESIGTWQAVYGWNGSNLEAVTVELGGIKSRSVDGMLDGGTTTGAVMTDLAVTIDVPDDSAGDIICRFIATKIDLLITGNITKKVSYIKTAGVLTLGTVQTTAPLDGVGVFAGIDADLVDDGTDNIRPRGQGLAGDYRWGVRYSVEKRMAVA